MIPPEKYQEAVIKLNATKSSENRMIININCRLVVPFKDGMTLMGALANAEKLDGWVNTAPIVPVDRQTIETTLMDSKRYQQHKIAALLGVSVTDVLEAEEAAKNPQHTP